MPWLLIGLLTVYTLALGLENPSLFKDEWPWVLVYYGMALLGDLATTLKGLEKGYREGNLLYARALTLGPWGMPLVDLGLISLKTVFLNRLTDDPVLSYALALTIGGHGHLVGTIWNTGQLLRR